MGSVCRGYVVAGLTKNKTKPSSWGLAELGNDMNTNDSMKDTLYSINTPCGSPLLKHGDAPSLFSIILFDKSLGETNQ